MTETAISKGPQRRSIIPCGQVIAVGYYLAYRGAVIHRLPIEIKRTYYTL